MNVCRSPYDIVSASEEAKRAFATLGLLRLVTDATPIDLICTYIIQTEQSWGMKQRMIDINDNAGSYWQWRTHMTVDDNHRADRVKMIPDGFVKMAKDYLIRAFWKQIDHLRSSACMRFSTNYDDKTLKRVYPKELLRTLSSLYLPASAKLYDIRNAINSLHAVATPTMLDAPSWVKPFNRSNMSCDSAQLYSHRIDKNQFDVMRFAEERNISMLKTKLDSYCWDETNRQSIPNEIEKNLLLDLIECFLIMYGPDTFADNYINRQTYEYARLYDMMGGSEPKQESKCFRNINNYTTDGGGYYGWRWDDGRVSILENLRYLSPEAAICMGSINTYWGSAAGTINPKLLETIHPQPITEVALFLRQELNVQSIKIKYAQRIREAYAKGEFSCEILPNGEIHECCDQAAKPACCPA